MAYHGAKKHTLTVVETCSAESIISEHLQAWCRFELTSWRIAQVSRSMLGQLVTDSAAVRYMPAHLLPSQRALQDLGVEPSQRALQDLGVDGLVV